MLDFQVPKITAENVEDNRGTFTVEPLDRGFGYTFGNSLQARAALLACGRSRDLDPHRGRGARVLDDRRASRRT